MYKSEAQRKGLDWRKQWELPACNQAVFIAHANYQDFT